MVTKESEAKVREHMKYCAARHIYKTGIAEAETQRSQKSQSKKKVREDYSDWFQTMYGENYYEYIDRKKEEKINGTSQENIS